MLSPENPRRSASSSSGREPVRAALHQVEVEQLVADRKTQCLAFVHVHRRARGMLDSRADQSDLQRVRRAHGWYSTRRTSPTMNTYENTPSSATMPMNASAHANEPVTPTTMPTTSGVTMPARFAHRLKTPALRAHEFLRRHVGEQRPAEIAHALSEERHRHDDDDQCIPRHEVRDHDRRGEQQPGDDGQLARDVRRARAAQEEVRAQAAASSRRRRRR